MHKTNVWVDLSGWRPKYIPDEVKRDARGRLSDRFVWGSDYPMLDPGRILDEFDEMGLGDKEEDVLKNNAARLLGIELLIPRCPKPADLENFLETSFRDDAPISTSSCRTPSS